MKHKLIVIIIPVFNNPRGPVITAEKLVSFFNTAGREYRILFVNDGSMDRGETSGALRLLCEQYKNISLIEFGENRGQQTALFAGIKTAVQVMEKPGEYMIATMDDDLEHPIELLPGMEDRIDSGLDLVYGVPETGRKKEKTGSSARDLFFRKSLGTPRGLRVGSYRLMTGELAEKITGTNKKQIYGFTDNTPHKRNRSFVYISAEAFMHGIRAEHLEYKVPEDKKQ